MPTSATQVLQAVTNEGSRTWLEVCSGAFVSARCHSGHCLSSLKHKQTGAKLHQGLSFSVHPTKAALSCLKRSTYSRSDGGAVSSEGPAFEGVAHHGSSMHHRRHLVCIVLDLQVQLCSSSVIL